MPWRVVARRALARATRAPGEFVSGVAAQLARALPAYRAALEADDAEGLRARLSSQQGSQRRLGSGGVAPPGPDRSRRQRVAAGGGCPR